jgi:Leucine-rich repeat (LRR) protein
MTQATATSSVEAECGETANLTDTCYLQLDVENRTNITLKLSESIKSSQNMTNLIIEDQRMFFMPSNLKEYFPNITELKIINSSLKEISNKNLDGFKDLEILHIIGNEIREISPNLFENNKKLIKIDLSENRIQLIYVEAFQDLKLKSLNVDGNQCIESGSDEKNLTATKNLIVLSCNYQKFLRFELKDLRNEVEDLRGKYQKVNFVKF